MSKGKLAKFADLETYGNVFQYPYSVVEHVPFAMKGRWHEDYFHNDNPIVLELGCGKGEYTVGLARKFPQTNFIGVDIKGARLWTGATEAMREGLTNVAFLRTNIEVIDRFFTSGEVQEIWLTFSDPQMKNPRKRLTSTNFLQRYRHFLVDNGIIHVKTDSNFLFTYTTLTAAHNHLPVVLTTSDLYGEMKNEEVRMKNEGTPTDLPTMAAANSSFFILHSSFTLKEAASIQTYYEQMWLDRGISIKYMQFRLPQEGELQEPDVEIPLDEYRSYKRDKRSTKETAK